MSVKKLSIKGFQSHQDTELEFHPGFNVIVGTNNSGKTAIIRALRKVCYDEPAGADFVNDQMTECEICLTLDNGSTITRTVQAKRDEDGRSTLATHSYKVDDEKFTSFGRQIPEVVLETHGMRVLDFKGSGPSLNLNFQGQQDTPFLLVGVSGSHRAKALSLVSGIELTDQAVAEINRRIRSLSGNIKTDQAHIAEMSIALDDLPPEDQVEKYREEIPKLMDEAIVLGKEVLYYAEAATTLKESTKTVAQYRDLVEALGCAILAFVPVQAGCETLADDLEKLQDLLEEYEEALEAVVDTKSEADRVAARRLELIEEIVDLLDVIDVCPTCGQDLDDEHKQHL